MFWYISLCLILFQVSVLRLTKCWSRPSVWQISMEQPSPSSSLQASSSSSHLSSPWFSCSFHVFSSKTPAALSSYRCSSPWSVSRMRKVFVNQEQDHSQEYFSNMFCTVLLYIMVTGLALNFLALLLYYCKHLWTVIFSFKYCFVFSNLFV